jgi:hypothetical protein
MTSPEKQRLREAQQLLALRQLHLRAAEKSWQRAREQAQEHQRIVDARVAEIAGLKERGSRLTHWLSGPGAGDLPAMNERCRALRAVLDDQLEQAESNLLDEQDDLAQSRRLEAQQRAAWLRAKAAVDAAEQLCTAAQKALMQRGEARAELELDDTAPRLPHALSRTVAAKAHTPTFRRST